MHLRGQTACGIDQDHIFFTCFTGAHRVIADRGGIAAFLADDLHRIALSPNRQLLARRSAKGICCGQQHGSALVCQAVGEFANGGGFARTIDAGHHHDGGLFWPYDQTAL